MTDFLYVFVHSISTHTERGKLQRFVSVGFSFQLQGIVLVLLENFNCTQQPTAQCMFGK